MSFLSLVTILRSIQPINGHFSPQSLKDIFPNIPAKDKAVVFVLQKREEEYRVAKLGCRLINTRSQSYCVSYKAEMAPWEPPQILVSTLLQLHDCSGPLCFDWRRNELPLNQTVLINLFHTTNIPYFSQHSSNHTKPDWSTTFDFFFFFQALELCTSMIQSLNAKKVPIWEKQQSGFGDYFTIKCGAHSVWSWFNLIKFNAH